MEWLYLADKMTDAQIRMMLLDDQFNTELFLSESNFQFI